MEATLGNRKSSATEVLRWIGIAAFGGFGVWETIIGGRDIIKHPDGDWTGTMLAIVFAALVCAPFYIVAFICFRRRYRELVDVVAFVGGIVVFCFLVELPLRLHIHELFQDRYLEGGAWNELREMLGLPVSVLCLFGPFYAAAWFFRWCRRMVEPRQKGNTD